MSKQKTIKAIAKRFRVTGTGKVKKVKSGQNHYNARESGKVRRNKRMDITAGSKRQQKTIKTLI